MATLNRQYGFLELGPHWLRLYADTTPHVSICLGPRGRYRFNIHNRWLERGVYRTLMTGTVTVQLGPFQVVRFGDGLYAMKEQAGLE